MGTSVEEETDSDVAEAVIDGSDVGLVEESEAEQAKSVVAELEPDLQDEDRLPDPELELPPGLEGFFPVNFWIWSV